MKAWIPVSLALFIAQAPVSPDTEPEQDVRGDTVLTEQPGLQPGEASPAPPGAVRPGPADQFPLVEPGPGPLVEPEPETDLELGPTPGLRLGQEPEEEDVQPFGGDLLEETPEPEEVRPSQELRQLRLRLQQFEAQLQQRQALEQQAQAEQQQAQERLLALEEQQAALQARALELQQLQQQRLVSLERAYGWFVTAENQLDVGNLDEAGPALTYADEALAVALATALEAGRDQTVLLLERARDRVYVIRQALDERDVYVARTELQLAALEVRQAWQQALNRPDAANLIR